METVMNKITTFIGGLTSLMLSFVSISILAEVIFGVGVFGTSVVENVDRAFRSSWRWRVRRTDCFNNFDSNFSKKRLKGK